MSKSKKRKAAPKDPDENRDLAYICVAHLRARELGRRHYAKSDRLLEVIAKKIKPGSEVPLPGGKVAKLKDNFAGTSKVFRSHGISRYELEVSP